MTLQNKKMALGPYINRIARLCEKSSDVQLTNIIISLAREIDAQQRQSFYEKIIEFADLPETIEPSSISAEQTDTLLDEIDLLRESIETRIEAVESGEYWDDSEYYESDYGEYDDEPDPVSEDQLDELASFFDEAARLFLTGDFEATQTIYAELFALTAFIESRTYSGVLAEIDLGEAHARFCRATYDTTSGEQRLKAFTTAMNPHADPRGGAPLEAQPYPLMQDVIDAFPGTMKGLDDFLPRWIQHLSDMPPGNRVAHLLLEASRMTQGLNAVTRLAREWQAKQPLGYLFWLQCLADDCDWDAIPDICTECLALFPSGQHREMTAQFLIVAGRELQNEVHILNGMRERFISRPSDRYLLDLVETAGCQGKREDVLQAVSVFLADNNQLPDSNDTLLIKTDLMRGELQLCLDRVKKARSVGWSTGPVGIVFGAVLSMAAGYSGQTTTVNELLVFYAQEQWSYSGRFSIIDKPDQKTSFFSEIQKGLKLKTYTQEQSATFFHWARKLGENRIDHIVSNTHRGAYDRAAIVLGALAEVLVALEKEALAVKLIHNFCKQKYPRHSAFRREVRAVVSASTLLKRIGIKV